MHGARHSARKLGSHAWAPSGCHALTAMPTHLPWHEIAVRLLLTCASAGIIGLDRDERGRSAGLRTNVLVALAACVAMIQANLLINSSGKPSNSFIVMDTMRLPLGILSGIGFIGAGAIIKRGKLVVGLTTAATLWFVTVMGLCYGGGQIGLGLAAFALGFLVLSGLKGIENHMTQEQTGELQVSVSQAGPSRQEIETILGNAGIGLTNSTLRSEKSPAEYEVFGWTLRWKAKRAETKIPVAVQNLAARPGVERLELTR